jgi:dipeptidyl aminopeptidase/acylaminoacyl peptidase
MVIFIDHQSQNRTIEYRQTPDNMWQVIGESDAVPEVGHGGLEVTVTEGLNEAPQFVATNKRISRVIWDPNPQLKNIEFGEASIYTWKDKEARNWRGGLFKPINYKAGQRYPLVIQTHGFVESEFVPSGLFSTAFAARALAVAGIMVLQIAEHCPMQTAQEGPCAVSGYEAAANKLVSEGLVDPEKIGIIGFSRTCFYVMETLTTSSLHLKAASINDGIMETYFQYLMWIDRNPEADSMIGAPPFGEGLQRWLKRSPGFNLDKVAAPLLVNGCGPSGVLAMWEVYAGLRYLHKPVDLILLNTDEHVLTNPAVRMASQGGSVDWFRFWLQDYEDSDPAKADQYKRWHELRKLQEENRQHD